MSDCCFIVLADDDLMGLSHRVDYQLFITSLIPKLNLHANHGCGSFRLLSIQVDRAVLSSVNSTVPTKNRSKTSAVLVWPSRHSDRVYWGVGTSQRLGDWVCSKNCAVDEIGYSLRYQAVLVGYLAVKYRMGGRPKFDNTQRRRRAAMRYISEFVGSC